MRRWGLTTIVILAAAVRVLSWQPAWLQNFALIELLGPWLTYSSELLDTTCSKDATLPIAKSYLENRLALVPTNLRIQTYLGRIAWLEGRCDDAIQIWQQAMLHAEQFAGYELAKAGEVDHIPPELRLILADQAYARAVQLSETDDLQSAQAWFTQAFDLALQHRSAMALAVRLEQQGQAAEAEAIWQKMVTDLSPSAPDYWWATAQLKQSAGDWTAAAQAYIKGAELSADPYDYWLYAGRAWENTPQWEQAVAAYEKATTATPYPVLAYLGLGYVFLNQGNYEEALQYLHLAGDADPKHFRPYYYLGLTYYQTQDFENARQNLELALERNPGDAGVMHVLALVWYEGFNQPEEAEKWLMQAINRTDSPPAAWWLELGDWRLKQQRCAETTTAYNTARRLSTEAIVTEDRLKQYATLCGDGLPGTHLEQP